MDLSPQALREIKFRERLRGYDQDDVDELLERVAAGLEIVLERSRQATDRALRAEQKASEVGEGDDAMRRTLVLAQRTADLAIQEAREQAARIVASAEAQGQSLRAEAAEHAQRTIDDATRDAAQRVERLEARAQQLIADVAGLERHVRDERATLRAAHEDALRRIDETVPSLGAPPTRVAPPATPETGPSGALAGGGPASASTPWAPYAEGGDDRTATIGGTVGPARHDGV